MPWYVHTLEVLRPEIIIKPPFTAAYLSRMK